MSDFRIQGKIIKVDKGLGLVFGYGIICKVDGQPYFDTQGDHIPEDSMLSAVTEFMLNSRRMDEMHDEVVKGGVVYSFPLTEDIAKAYGMTVKQTGWLIGVKPEDPAILEKFESGEYTGFSIGGFRGIDEEVQS